MPAPKTARHLALDGLSQVIGEGRMLSEVMTDSDWSAATAADRAAAQRLLTQTLRALGQADHVLKPFLQRPPPLRVMNVLRMATMELMSGGAAHGVVNESVNLVARSRKTAPMKGLVNAVLRKVTQLEPSEWSKAPVSRTPKWLRSKLVKAWGEGATQKMERVHAAAPPVDVTPKTRTSNWETTLDGTMLATGSVRLTEPGQISARPGFQEGEWWVQDAAAALPVRLLGDVKGLRVLDICAAPGGKTMQLAAAGADVTALDISEKRMARVRENLTRTGLSAKVVVADALQYSGGPFDVVLLDAPCSATGTIRRHPDLPFAKNQSNLKELVELQRQMLSHCLSLLKPGGKLLFCTCSLLPEEGERQASWVLSQHPMVKIVPPEFQGLDTAWQSPEGGVRLRPDYWADKGGMDGFYMALLQLAGETPRA